jgi:hypothetical protein
MQEFKRPTSKQKAFQYVLKTVSPVSLVCAKNALVSLETAPKALSRLYSTWAYCLVGFITSHSIKAQLHFLILHSAD